MAITTQMRTEVSQLYVALFGRAPDGEGLGFWVQLRDQGQSLEQIANTMYATTPARTYYPSFLTNQEIIASFYSNVLGRAADADGLAFWTAKLNTAGATPGSVIAEMINIVSNYTALGGTDPAGVTSSNLFNNRVAVAQYYGEKNGTVAGATAVLAGVTADSATVTAAIQDIDAGNIGGVNQGQTFTLTKAVDLGAAFTGTNGNDTFVGVDDATDANDTLNVGDSLNGGTGSDTFQIVLGDTVAEAPAVTLNAIETVLFTGSEASGAFDAGSWNGVTTIAASGLGASGTDTDTVTVNNLQAAAAVKLENVGVAAANADAVSLTWADTKAGGASAALNLDVSSVGSTTVPVDVKVGTTTDIFKTVSIAATGKNNVALEGAAAGDVDLTTVNVSGSGSLTFAASTNVSFANVATVDASKNTGGVTIDLTASTKNATVTGGTGADALTVNLATNLTVNAGAGNDVVTIAAGTGTAANLSSTTGAADAINGGEGTDSLAMVSADAAALAGDTAADRGVLTGFERVRVTDSLANNFAINAFGVNYLELANTVTGTITVSGFSSGATVDLRNAANMGGILAVGITGADASTTDVLNVNLNADLTANDTQYTHTLDIDGINTVNINAVDRVAATNPDTDTSGANVGIEGYVVNLGGTANDDVLKTITITGDKFVSYTESATATALGTVDGSAATGRLVINAAAHAGTEGVTISGGSAADVLTGGAKTDTINGGAGSDVIDGGASGDMLTGGAGADVFILTAANSGPTAAGAGIDKISDYTGNAAITSADVLRLAAGDNVKAGGGTAVQGVSIAVDANGKATFASATDTMTEIVTDLVAGTAANEVVFFEFSGNTYVYSSGAAGDGTNDVMVQLTGVTGLTKVTESTTTAGDFWLQA